MIAIDILADKAQEYIETLEEFEVALVKINNQIEEIQKLEQTDSNKALLLQFLTLYRKSIQTWNKLDETMNSIDKAILAVKEIKETKIQL